MYAGIGDCTVVDKFVGLFRILFVFPRSYKSSCIIYILVWCILPSAFAIMVSTLFIHDCFAEDVETQLVRSGFSAEFARLAAVVASMVSCLLPRIIKLLTLPVCCSRFL